MGNGCDAGQVLGVVLAAERSPEFTVALGGPKPEESPPFGFGPEERGNIGGVVITCRKSDGRVHDLACSVPEQGVVPAYYGRTALAQVFEQDGLGPGHSGLGPEPLQVSGADVGYHGDVRAGDGREFLHVARDRDAKLHDPQFLLRSGLEHGHGKADLVVEIAVVPGSVEPLRDHCVQHLLDRCLASRASDRYQPCPAHVAPACGQAPKRNSGVPDHYHRGVDVFQHAGRDNACRSVFGGLPGEFVAVEVLAVNAEEQVAFLHGATVRPYRLDGYLLVALFGRAIQAAFNISQGQIHSISSMALITASRSEKWIVSPLIC